jgi:integrase
MSIEATRAGRAFRHIAGPDVDDFEAAARADATWCTYSSGMRNLSKYCEARGVVALPADTKTLKAWIKWLVDDGYTAATVATYWTAVCTAHDAAGHPIDRRPLRTVLKAVRRSAPARRKAAPLLRDDLEGILGMLNPERAIDARDACLALLGWARAMRQSELTGLDWQRPAPRREGGRGVLRTVRGGYEIELERSKSSQEQAVKLLVLDRDMPSLAQWLDAWVRLAQIEPGSALFRYVDRKGAIAAKRVKPGAVCEMVRRRMRRLLAVRGAKPTEAFHQAWTYSGHSLRAGCASTMADNGVPEWKIRSWCRHKTPSIAAGYIRLSEDRHNSALKGIGL